MTTLQPVVCTMPGAEKSCVVETLAVGSDWGRGIASGDCGGDGSGQWDQPTAIDAACRQLSALHEKLRNIMDEIALTKARSMPARPSTYQAAPTSFPR